MDPSSLRTTSRNRPRPRLAALVAALGLFAAILAGAFAPGCSPAPTGAGAGGAAGAGSSTDASPPGVPSTTITSPAAPATTEPPDPQAGGVSLEEVRRQVQAGLASEPAPAGAGTRYAFLPYRLPEGFLPAARWGGEAGGDPGNPVVAGRFYGVALTDGASVMRVLVNPDDAPASLAGTLPPDDLEWTRTGAGAMQTEASEAVRDGVDYFRIREDDDEIVVSGPRSIRPAVWETMDGLAPVVVGGGAGVPATMPDDFEFVLNYGVMLKNRLDTAAGTFTYDMISDPPITTPLELTPQQSAEVYERLRAIDFWSYPPALRPEVGVEPSTEYALEISGAAWGSHETRGADLHYASSLPSVALWKLIERIQEMIEATDAFKALPEPRGGYL